MTEHRLTSPPWAAVAVAVAMLVGCAPDRHALRWEAAAKMREDPTLIDCANVEELPRWKRPGGSDVVCSGEDAAKCSEDCLNGNEYACNVLAAFYEHHDAPHCAITLRRFACDRGLSSGCGGLAWHYYKGAAVERDLKLAQRLGTAACAEQSGRGCRIAGLATENDALARDFFERACTLADESGCYMWGSRLLLGSTAALTREMGLDQLEASCDRGYARSCYLLSWHGNIGQRQGWAERACDLSDKWGCYQAGTAELNRGEGLRDLDKVNDLFARACSGKDGRGCTTAGKLLLGEWPIVGYNLLRARDRWWKACRNGDDSGCGLLLAYPWGEIGEPIAFDIARRRLETRCERNPDRHHRACYQLDLIRIEHASPPSRLQFARQAADRCTKGGDEEKCTEAAHLLLRIGRAKDALTLAKQADEPKVRTLSALLAGEEARAYSWLLRGAEVDSPERRTELLSWAFVLAPTQVDKDRVKGRLEAAIPLAHPWLASVGQWVLRGAPAGATPSMTAKDPLVTRRRQTLVRQIYFLHALRADDVVGATKAAKAIISAADPAAPELAAAHAYLAQGLAQ